MAQWQQQCGNNGVSSSGSSSAGDGAGGSSGRGCMRGLEEVLVTAAAGSNAVGDSFWH
jgi:hypothetical protein